MVTTASVNSRRTVGVAPGTTTMMLTGPTADADPIVGCENPDRVARQKYLLNPPGKFQQLTDGAVQAASTMIKTVSTVVDPYETLESLKGALGGLGRSALRGLGLVLSPAGDQSPNPSYQLVAATKSRMYCTKRPERSPNYRWNDTSAYEPESRHAGVNGLGAVPTDIQLSSQYGYTPVVSQWIPFKEGTWAPAPWNPPRGATSSMPQDQGYWTAPTTGTMTTVATGQPLNEYLGGLGRLGAEAAVALDPITASLEEQRRHEDRMFLLGIVSAAAVASTAMINVFRYATEKKSRRGHTRVAAEPPALISGVRRRRRNRSR